MFSAHRLVRVVGALVTATALVMVGVVSAAPAPAGAAVSASSTTLCKGFTACAKQGRSHAGYAPVYRRSF